MIPRVGAGQWLRVAPALACLTLLFALIGGRSALALLLAGAALALPGFALLGRPRSTVGALLRGLVGLSLSSAGVVVAGVLGLSFAPSTWLSISALFAGVAGVLRRSFSSQERAAAFERHPRDQVALALVCGFALFLTAPALFGVGRSVDGAVHYSAFFCADLFKHAAHAGSLASGPLPPVDPFSAGASLHYYWLSYVLPAAALQIGGTPLRAIEILLGQTLLQTFALATLLYGLARKLGPGPRAAAAAAVLGFASLSLDGLAAWLESPHSSLFTRLQSSNVESLDLTRLLGAPEHFAASTLYRLCLYVPQHQLAVLLLLGWAHISLRSDARTVPLRAARAVCVAVLPLVSLLVAPAALLAIVLSRLGLCIADRNRPSSGARAELCIDALAVMAAALLIFFGAAIGPPGDTGAARELLRDDMGPSTRLLWFGPQLLTSFGGMLVLGLLGAVRALGGPARMGPARVLPLVVFAGGVGCLILAEVLLPRSDLRMNVELKASFVTWLALVLGSSLVFQELRRPSAIAQSSLGIAGLLFLLGAPSILHDVYWHSTLPSDRALRQKWHVSVPNADMAALDWVRKHLPVGARFVQPPSPSFLEGGVDAWVPVFAGRPVVTAPRASVRSEPRLEQARRLFRASDVGEALRLARELGAHYVYLSQALEPAEHARLTRMLGSDERAFQAVYSAASVSIWRVM